MLLFRQVFKFSRFRKAVFPRIRAAFFAGRNADATRTRPASLLFLMGFGALFPAGAPLASAYAGETSGSTRPPALIRCGLIWIEVDPGPAEISLDGEYLDSGVWLLSVPPGEHEIRVRKTGFHPYSARVRVAPGGEVRLDIRLLPIRDG